MDGSIVPVFRDFYAAVPELKRIPLFVDSAPRNQLFQSIDPDLRVIFFRPIFRREEYAGKTAAEMMMQLIRSGGGKIENRVVQIPYEKLFQEHENTKIPKKGGIEK